MLCYFLTISFCFCVFLYLSREEFCLFAICPFFVGEKVCNNKLCVVDKNAIDVLVSKD